MEKHHQNFIILKFCLGIFTGKEILGKIIANTNFLKWTFCLDTGRKIKKKVFHICALLTHCLESFALPGLEILHRKIQYILMNAEGTPVMFPFRDDKSRPFSEILEMLGDAGLNIGWQTWKLNATSWTGDTRSRRNTHLLLITNLSAEKEIEQSYVEMIQGFENPVSRLAAETIFRGVW